MTDTAERLLRDSPPKKRTRVSKEQEALQRQHFSEYLTWRQMRDRCFNPSSHDYHKYGGRGITVCEEWRHSFVTFFTDMGPRPDGLTIERINNDGNYDPENCRWATVKEQARNTRFTRHITFAGKTMCMKDWAKHLGLSYTAFRERVAKWPIEKAISFPYQKDQCRGN